MFVLDHSFMQQNEDRTLYSCASNLKRHADLVLPESYSPPPTNDARGDSARGNRAERSSSIPLPASHVPRTQSEVQLSLDQEVAEARDVSMFYRLINGIRERHHDDMIPESIASIVRSRLSDVATPFQAANAESLEMEHEIIDHRPFPELHLRVSPVTEVADDGWSVTGYPPLERIQIMETIPTAVCDEHHEEEESHDEDDGVFPLDL